MTKEKVLEMFKRVDFYVDMDGVLADFFGVENAVERFKVEPHFFKNLNPIYTNVLAVNRMLDKGLNVYIMTKSPHANADNDKKLWVQEYLPRLRNKMLIVRPNDNKSDNIMNRETKFSLLLDDYGQNIKEWNQNKNCLGLKVDRKNNITKLLKFTI